MKIVIDSRGEDIESHARSLVAEAAQKRKTPHGVAAHSAKVPERCDDCGQTYWHRNDPFGWYPHLGCKGEVKDEHFGF